MRKDYHQKLDDLLDQLVRMAGQVREAVKTASEALLEADLTKAESVISRDADLDALHEELEYECVTLLARQAPVAGELRTIVSAIRVVFELARMGDLAAHIAKIARLRYPQRAVPDELAASFARMGVVAQDMVALAQTALAERDPDKALALASDDEEMDELRAMQFKVMLAPEWGAGVEKAVDAALLGRYFERLSDHAVAVGRRVIFLATGHAPEGEDWPNA